MPIVNLPSVKDEPTLEEVVDYIERMRKELTWLLDKNIDTKNAREFAGWLIRPDKIVSKDGDVGMATTDTADDDVRFFAGPNGDVWFYYVTKSGKLYATDAFITGRIEGSVIVGSEIKTAEDTYPRVELSSTNNLFQALASTAKYIQIVPDDLSGTPALFMVDGANKALMFQSGNQFTLGTLGTSVDLSLQADRHLLLKADFGQVKVDNWSEFANASSGQTLQQALDNLQNQINSLSSRVSALGG